MKPGIRVTLLLFLACGFWGCGGSGKPGHGTGGTGGATNAAHGGAGGDGSAGNSGIGSLGTSGTGSGGASLAGLGAGRTTGGTFGTAGGSLAGAGGGLVVGGSAGAGGLGGVGTAGAPTAGSSGVSSGGGGGGLASGGSTGIPTVGGTRTGGASGGGTGGVGSGGSRSGGTGAGGVASGGATGTGGASLRLDRSRMDFGSITLGTTSTSTFTLTNDGGAVSGRPTINVEYLTAPGGTVTGTGCDAALAPGASCVLTIKATPARLGLSQSFVRVTANPGTPDTSSSALSIYVVGRAIGFELSPLQNIDLGDVAPGVSVEREFTITALVDLSDLKIAAGGEELAIEPSSTCTAVLGKGAACLVNVKFVAGSIGWKRVSLGVRAGGDLGQFASVEFTANVSKANGLSIAPKTPPVYACMIEQTSEPVVFTVTNVSGTPSGEIVSTIVGESARDFRIAGTDCTTLALNATCTISVVCSPPMSASAATRNAVLSVTDGDTHLSVPLTAEVKF